MTENWDEFEAFKVLQKQSFTFQPTRFETWIGGKMVGNGSVTALISANTINQNGNERMLVKFDEPNLKAEILSELIFDTFITASDRLQLITIPEVTNSNNMAIAMFKMIIGATRDNKNFISTEPYCCNLFLKNGVLSKITFSFSNPEKLVELYL
jgi:hypothetical protein